MSCKYRQRSKFHYHVICLPKSVQNRPGEHDSGHVVSEPAQHFYRFWACLTLNIDNLDEIWCLEHLTKWKIRARLPLIHSDKVHFNIFVSISISFAKLYFSLLSAFRSWNKNLIHQHHNDFECKKYAFSTFPTATEYTLHLATCL